MMCLKPYVLPLLAITLNQANPVTDSLVTKANSKWLPPRRPFWSQGGFWCSSCNLVTKMVPKWLAITEDHFLTTCDLFVTNHFWWSQAVGSICTCIEQWVGPLLFSSIRFRRATWGDINRLFAFHRTSIFGKICLKIIFHSAFLFSFIFIFLSKFNLFSFVMV